jgi:aryl-alcohol dehydrogenase-like predicted oxidoreductase
MKIFGAGTLTRPEDRAASLRYVLGNDLVDAITIGTTAPGQVDENLQSIRRALSA